MYSYYAVAPGGRELDKDRDINMSRCLLLQAILATSQLHIFPRQLQQQQNSSLLHLHYPVLSPPRY
jgi:hypothetical protein